MLCIVVYLLRSDIWVNDVVEVFVNSIQQPEEEFLGVMLGVTFKLNGALWHHVLQETWKTATVLVRRHTIPRLLWLPHEIFSRFDIDNQHIPKGQQRCKWWWGTGLEKLFKTRTNARKPHKQLAMERGRMFDNHQQHMSASASPARILEKALFS